MDRGDVDSQREVPIVLFGESGNAEGKEDQDSYRQSFQDGTKRILAHTAFLCLSESLKLTASS
jgi:hypothetical protein